MLLPPFGNCPLLSSQGQRRPDLQPSGGLGLSMCHFVTEDERLESSVFHLQSPVSSSVSIFSLFICNLQCNLVPGAPALPSCLSLCGQGAPGVAERPLKSLHLCPRLGQPLLLAHPGQGLVVSGFCLPFSFLGWMTYGTTIGCLLYLRVKKKNLPRPYKVDFGINIGLFSTLVCCMRQIDGPQLRLGARGRM